MFNTESRHLLNLSIYNALDCIPENFSLKNFPGGACIRNSPEKCAIHSPHGRYCAHIATVYYISRLPLSQNPLSALCTNSSLHNCLYSVSYKHISWPIKASVKWGIINRVSTRNDLAGSCFLQVCEIAKLDSHGSSAFTSIGEHVMSRPLIAIQTCNLTLFSCCL